MRSSPESPRRSPSGRGATKGEGDEPSHRFRLDLREVSTVALNEKRNALVITVWTPDRGVRTIERA